MRGDAAAYELVSRPSLREVLALLAEEPGVWRPLAGGTDVMVLFNAGKLAHRRWVSLWNLSELRGIEVTADAITLGALSTYREVMAHPVIAEELPMLGRAGAETGAVAIQNRGTLGGNIANASPAADSPPALLAYGASIELTSARGARWLPYDAFHTGYKQTQLAQDELITRVRVPRAADPGSRLHFYRKVGPRRAQAISKVCFAACAEVRGGAVADVRIALGGVAPIVPRARHAEQAARGEGPVRARIERAKAALAKDIAPIDDVRSTARYRAKVAENLLVDFLLQLERRVELDRQG